MFRNIVFSAALVASTLAADILTSTVVTQFELGTWLESVAVRPNGDLLTTLIQPTPDIITVQHPSSDEPKSQLLTSIPSVSRLLGITEVHTGGCGVETYLVVGDDGNMTCSAYTVTFGRSENDTPTVSKVIDFSADTAFVNGIASIPNVDNAVLVTDSAAGRVGYLNITDGTFDAAAFDYEEMNPDEDAELVIGVNGIKVHDGHLYFSNTNSVSLFRIAVTEGGLPSPDAEAELVADLTTIDVMGVDDFALDKNGNIYVASNLDNKLVYIETASGTSTVVVGDDLEMTVAGDTAVAFGRDDSDASTLYVVTSGAQGAPVGGSKTEGAKVIAVDTSKLDL